MNWQRTLEGAWEGLSGFSIIIFWYVVIAAPIAAVVWICGTYFPNFSYAWKRGWCGIALGVALWFIGRLMYEIAEVRFGEYYHPICMGIFLLFGPLVSYGLARFLFPDANYEKL